MSDKPHFRMRVAGASGQTLSAKEEAANLVSLARGRVSDAAMRMRLKEASRPARVIAKHEIAAIEGGRYLDVVNEVCRAMGETEVE